MSAPSNNTPKNTKPDAPRARVKTAPATRLAL